VTDFSKFPTFAEELAAREVKRYLDRTDATPLPAEEIAKMSAAERIEYCRRFDQSQMPAWEDPRPQMPEQRWRNPRRS
jgi:hypothetical protein